MKILKRILSLITIVFFISSLSINLNIKNIQTVFAQAKVAKVAVFLLDFTDNLISEIRQNLEDIQKQNPSEVEYTFYDAKSDEATQNSQIEKAGIKPQQVALAIADWREDLAYNAMKTIYEKYKDQIEVIISNDDTMAIGAIKALQEYGYNNGDCSKTIPIVGVDVTPQAKEFIEKGVMLGSVYQSPKEYAEALYRTGMNMIAGKNPVEGTKYKLDDTRVSIRLPQTKYFYRNMFVGGNAIEGTI